MAKIASDKVEAHRMAHIAKIDSANKTLVSAVLELGDCPAVQSSTAHVSQSFQDILSWAHFGRNAKKNTLLYATFCYRY